jgi:2-dehydropantoate 2-reductase
MEPVLVYGLGAIGGFYASVLHKAGCQVSVVARSNYEAVKTNGLSLSSKVFGGSNFRPLEVFRSTKEASTMKFSFVVVTVKALDPLGLPDEISPVVTPGFTTIVIIQNGIGMEDPIQKKFPDNTIITCVTWVGVKQTEPGVITHNTFNSMTAGIFWNRFLMRDTEQKRVELFAFLLEKGGTGCEIEANMQIKRWEKVIWNAAWNSVTALTNLNTKDFLENTSPEALPLVVRLMGEMVSIAQASGVPIEKTIINQLLSKAMAAENGLNSSMQEDMRSSRPTEVEVILGNPLRLAIQHGVEAPILRTIYTLVKANDWRIRNKPCGS